MYRIPTLAAAWMAGLVPLLFDSGVKGAVLLVLAALAAAGLRKGSAAIRHFVWLIAIVALLLVPVLSAALPGWRVLPAWASGSHDRPVAAPASGVVGVAARPPAAGTGGAALSPGRMDLDPVAPGAAEPSGLVREPMASPIETSGLGWRDWLALAWAAGFGLLVVRLLVAHLLLCRAARRCAVPASGAPGDARVVAAFEAAGRELGVRQPVTLLIDDGRAIPVVWGIVRPRLLLPGEARSWGEAQLRSVLLHELAHLRRRDPLIQLLTQVACAFHWWNPLVWFAAWRIHVERERACDDLVLASGVRPSAYAGHLLGIATRLSPARWTGSCGLAMARRSSLEGRLAAVLGEKRNRRALTRALAVAMLLVGAVVAVPLSMLGAADEKPGETDEPTFHHEAARAVFAHWRAGARADGSIPGGLVGRLGGKVEACIALNRDDPAGRDLARRFEALLPRFDAGRDWTPAEAASLLDAVAAIHPIPLRTSLDSIEEATLRAGEPLPAELEDAPWGPPAPCGLRAAWLLEPRAGQLRLGSALRSRILYHNAGRQPVVFLAPSWQQPSGHAAVDASGAAIPVSSVEWTTLARMRIWRLAPGEFCETWAAGIALGPADTASSPPEARVGTWIAAKAGDDVRLSPAAVEARFSPAVVGRRLLDDSPFAEDPVDAADLWDRIVAERVGRELPVPTQAVERERLLHRLTLDLYGEPPTPEETAAFIADRSPAAENPMTAGTLLGQRLRHHRPGVVPFTGTLQPGEIRFHVIAADRNATGEPRTANGPGEFDLGGGVRLAVEETTEDGARFRRATIVFPRGPTGPEQSVAIALPGRDPFAFAWRTGSGLLWRLTADSLSRIDLTDPGRVTAEPAKPDEIEQLQDPALERSRQLDTRLVDAYNEAAKSVAGPWPLPARLIPGALAESGDPESARAAARVYWGVVIEGIGLDYNPGEPFDEDELVSLAQRVSRTGEAGQSAVRRLSWLICRAAAEKAEGVRELLGDPALRRVHDPHRGIALALAAYDYAVDGDRAALQSIVDALAEAEPGSDDQALCPLGFIDEWDLTITAYEEHFARGTDGAGGLAAGLFWLVRQCLFPESFDRYRAATRASGDSNADGGAEEGTVPTQGADGDRESAGLRRGASLEAATVARLQWGQPAHGLRMALVRPQALGERDAGEVFDFRLVVQNVSDAPVRLGTEAPAELTSRLRVRKDGRILAAFTGVAAAPGGWLLEPREAAVLRLFADRTEGPSVTRDDPALAFTAELEVGPGPAGTWTGTLATAETTAADLAPTAASESADGSVEWRRVRIDRKGVVWLDRRAVTLDALEAEATNAPARPYTIDADEDVPFARVAEVLDRLGRAGATNLSFRDGRMGDAKVCVANRTGIYRLDGGRKLAICRPNSRPQWFTVSWPPMAGWPRSALRVFPAVGEGTLGEWAVAWEPGTDVLWWIDDSDVGMLHLTDPAAVPVTREGRRNNFSRDFALPEEVKEAFRRLGFDVGRDRTPGSELLIGGNTGGQQVLSAETARQWIVEGTVTDADGQPVQDAPVRVRSELRPAVDLATTTTDEHGRYRMVFRVDLATLAAFRGIRVEPVVAGFATSPGDFNALFRAGEKPTRSGSPGTSGLGPASLDSGPIPRFADRDLVIDVPGQADFVLAPADPSAR